MYFYLVAFGLLAHVLLWGAGLALAAIPGRWRNFWPVLAVPAGLTLQALVVWAGVWAGLKGTNSYAWASELVPVVVLAAAIRWRGMTVLRAGLGKFWAVWGATAVVLAMLVAPLARAAKGLTTTSLGSCDAADYGAGARVLMEFARGERGGFMGLTEVVRVMSVDNFFDYWTRLNHFAPAALIALNGTILDCAPHELTSLMTMVLLAGSVPVVFWLARAGLGYGGRASWAIAAVYGVSPITWYAVAHTAMGQLLAAQAIAVVTWAGLALWWGRLGWARAASFGGALALAYGLALGSYGFILLIALGPVLACVVGNAIWRRQGKKLAAWSAAMLVPLGVAGVIFWERVAGLAERLALLQQYDFGWKIPWLGPEGWLGIVAATTLEPLSGGWRWGLAGGVVALLAAALVLGAIRRRSGAFAALGLTVIPLLGYGYLNFRGAQLGTNASYDAYKVLAVFYPGVLAGLFYWVTLDAAGWRRWLVVGCGLVVFALNLLGADRFTRAMQQPPLLVGRELLQVAKIEGRTDIASLNLRVPDMWSRLWLNALLLKKAQFFETHTYEARLNTEMKGEWDLTGGLIALQLPAGGSERINPHYGLVDTRSPYYLRARLGDGWYEPEQIARTGTRWNWTKGDATLRLENPQSRRLRVVMRGLLRSEEPRDLQLWLNGQRVETWTIAKDLERRAGPVMELPSGSSVLELRSSTPPTGAGAGAGRPLGFVFYEIELDVLAEALSPKE